MAADPLPPSRQGYVKDLCRAVLMCIAVAFAAAFIVGWLA